MTSVTSGGSHLSAIDVTGWRERTSAGWCHTASRPRGGRIVETGTHADLMTAGGHDAELFSLQAKACR